MHGNKIVLVAGLEILARNTMPFAERHGAQASRLPGRGDHPFPQPGAASGENGIPWPPGLTVLQTCSCTTFNLRKAVISRRG